MEEKNVNEKSQYKMLTSHFLKSLSHEVRTPANGIMGFAEILDDETDNEEHKEYLHLIKKSAGRLLEVMTDLVDISRIKADEYPVRLHRFKVYELLDELRNDLNSKSNDNFNPEKISWPTESNQTELHSDIEGLKKILEKLLDNAIKYSDNTEVTLDFNIESGMAHFIVTDRGPGIMDARSVVEVFDQEEQKDKKLNPGLGLGLSIAKGIADLIDAEIKFSSREGKGTKVTVSLPVKS